MNSLSISAGVVEPVVCVCPHCSMLFFSSRCMFLIVRHCSGKAVVFH